MSFHHFFNHRAKRGGSLSGVAFGGRRWVTPVRGFSQKNWPQILEFWNETWRERGFGHAAGDVEVFFFTWPPGAEQLGAEGENMGVLAFFEGFKGYNGP